MIQYLTEHKDGKRKTYMIIPIWRWKIKILDRYHYHELDCLPWYMGIWKYNPCTRTTHVLPIPLATIMRMVYMVWQKLIWLGPISKREREMSKAYHLGFENGRVAEQKRTQYRWEVYQELPNGKNIWKWFSEDAHKVMSTMTVEERLVE